MRPDASRDLLILPISPTDLNPHAPDLRKNHNLHIHPTNNCRSKLYDLCPEGDLNPHAL